MGLLSGLIADQKKRLTNVKETFQLIGSNIKEGKLNQGVPVSAKYEGTPIGKAIEKSTSPIGILKTAGVVAVAAKPVQAFGALKETAIASFKAPAKATKIALGSIFAFNTVSASPTIAKAVINLPSDAGKLGKNIGQAVENKDLQSLKDIATETPILTGAALVVGGAGLFSAVQNYSNTQAIKENTEATLKNLKNNYLDSGKAPSNSDIKLIPTPPPKKDKPPKPPKKPKIEEAAPTPIAASPLSQQTQAAAIVTPAAVPTITKVTKKKKTTKRKKKNVTKRRKNTRTRRTRKSTRRKSKKTKTRKVRRSTKRKLKFGSKAYRKKYLGKKRKSKKRK